MNVQTPEPSKYTVSVVADSDVREPFAHDGGASANSPPSRSVFATRQDPVTTGDVKCHTAAPLASDLAIDSTAPTKVLVISRYDREVGPNTTGLWRDMVLAGSDDPTLEGKASEVWNSLLDQTEKPEHPLHGLEALTLDPETPIYSALTVMDHVNEDLADAYNSNPNRPFSFMACQFLPHQEPLIQQFRRKPVAQKGRSFFAYQNGAEAVTPAPSTSQNSSVEV